MTSILTSIKKLLGIDKEYIHFDTDIMFHINSVIMTLTQIGVGPSSGFFITGDTETWENLLGDRKDLESVKTYIYLKVRLLFDPPSTSYLIEAMERQIREIEWRLNVQTEPPVSTETETIP